MTTEIPIIKEWVYDFCYNAQCIVDYNSSRSSNHSYRAYLIDTDTDKQIINSYNGDSLLSVVTLLWSEYVDSLTAYQPRKLKYVLYPDVKE